MDTVSFIAVFTFVFLAELGDKTQLTLVALSSKGSAASVFAGSMLAFFLVDGLSALIGGELLSFLPSGWMSLISGLIFTFYGFLSLIHKDREIGTMSQKATFLKAFLMISLMELGDKTHLASILLAAELKSPLTVLLSIMLAFSVVTGIGVIFGTKLLRLLPEKYLRMGAALLFVFFGFFFILDAITVCCCLYSFKKAEFYAICS